MLGRCGRSHALLCEHFCQGLDGFRARFAASGFVFWFSSARIPADFEASPEILSIFYDLAALTVSPSALLLVHAVPGFVSYTVRVRVRKNSITQETSWNELEQVEMDLGSTTMVNETAGNSLKTFSRYFVNSRSSVQIGSSAPV